MAYRIHRLAALAIAAIAGSYGAEASSAYLFWMPPSFAGEPVRGDEPGIGLPLPGATEKEVQANLMWNMRAGLNVAALQCQFAPPLMTVRNYNDLLKHHARELNDAYNTISGYFKRTGGKGWQSTLDQYTTRTYNGFSTLHAQMGFCETAAAIGRDALARRKGELYLTARTRMREFRNSLVPAQDRLFAFIPVLGPRKLPPLAPECWSRKNRFVDKKCGEAARR